MDRSSHRSGALSLPQILLVDDSEAVLALEKAALAGHYAISTASDGREALAKLQQLKPDGVVLDLTMPHMGGEEVLRRMAAAPELRRIPAIVASSETERAGACLRAGAKAFLPKPVRADELLALVSRVLEEAQREKQRASLAVVFVSVGAQELGIPIECVRSVLHQIATRPLPVGPSYLSEFVEVHGEPVLVLDLARRLGLDHAQPLEERQLVMVEMGGLQLALCVDRVRDPEEIGPSDLVRRERLGGADHGPLQAALLGMARTPRGPLPLIDPSALVSRKLLRELSQAIGSPSRVGPL